ncbi:TPA: hypothetical protein ACPJ0Q_003934 [Vibrio diabolicus]|uniref:hypothetical protein n=1 Tax=Vibrio diabolicus subgroup TaxID=2315253 RepID=UPI00045CF389|nr:MULTISPECIES: hypothetical protein [Vibrio diabolicus subgroup]MCR9676040.1 hypothetical protein [Vibrio alginolyticus]GAJ76697.1 hypothetical protein JCM18905_2523 [Vibrio sp. JCM 18905]MCE9846457.1 hypothetical protein [Vibrio antiquarius]MCR9364922.1 hypothetical protein [Vibrio antiquarius]MCR9545069.1 hypothetical protein [Vibrio antiquarius]
MEYPIQLFVYLNEQDAEQTRIVSNVIKDTVQDLNRLLQSIKRKAKYGVTKLSSSMLIF